MNEKDNNTLIVQMANDIGFIRGVIQPIVDADLVTRVTASEVKIEQHEVDIQDVKSIGKRRFNTAIILIGSLSTFVSAGVAVVLVTQS